MKKQHIVLLGLIAIFLNSCVYSLFPIYTKDTLVFKQELLGMWDLEDGTYMIFRTREEADKALDGKEEKEKKHKYEIVIKEDFTISSDEPIFVMIDGKKVFDEDSIRQKILAGIERDDDEEDSGLSISSETADKMVDNKPKIKDFKGTVEVYDKDKSYVLTVVDEEEDKETHYTAHLANVGGDLFLDLYPITNFNSDNFSDNFFPVHTFYKVEITEDEFTMIHFDLDKLNDLFESNLIRLRHENVDGTILITAQPKELQKFFDKYADDESVFDSRETYKRATL